MANPYCSFWDCTIPGPHGHGTDVTVMPATSPSRKEVEQAIDDLEFCAYRDCGHPKAHHHELEEPPGVPGPCKWGGCLCKEFKPREEPRGRFFDDNLKAAWDAAARWERWKILGTKDGSTPLNYDEWRARLADGSEA